MQVQGHDTIATIDILERIGIGAWLGVSLVVPFVVFSCADGVVDLFEDWLMIRKSHMLDIIIRRREEQ